jgi:hypothetical protein
VAEVLLISFFCLFRVLWELHNDQGCNFEFRQIQEVLQCLGVSKTQTTPLYAQLDGMVECYIKIVEEHLQNAVALHQRDWDARLPFFLLVYRASIHDTMGLTLTSLMFGTELHLSCGLLFVATPNRE